jgi:hypothetical protein
VKECPRFDLYSVVMRNNEYGVIQLSKGVPIIVAQILAGVTNRDFVESVVNEGWVGTCPQWRNYMPMVALPRGELLGMDQLEFMLESIEFG